MGVVASMHKRRIFSQQNLLVFSPSSQGFELHVSGKRFLRADSKEKLGFSRQVRTSASAARTGFEGNSIFWFSTSMVFGLFRLNATLFKQYIFNLGMVKIGRPDRKECEAIFNRVQKIWKENSK